MTEFFFDQSITLGQLYIRFSKLKTIEYEEIPFIEGDLEITKEMVFNVMQKELYAQSKISAN